jgi:short-subunit dehydrogenase
MKYGGDMLSLKSKTCLVTGGTRGIGKAIATELESEGCTVLAVGKDKGDLATEEGVFQLIEYVDKKIKQIDILVNCAGVYKNKSIDKCTLTDFNDIFNVNIKAPWLLCREYIPDMIKNSWGRIVNFGSIASYHGHMNQSIYNASKHAILGMSRALFKELNDYNIRVYCVSPGGTQTEMGKECLGNQDYSTFLEPEEIAKYIIFNLKFDNQLIATEIRLNRIFITRLEKLI